MDLAFKRKSASQEEREKSSQSLATLSDSLRTGNSHFPHLVFTRSQNMHLFFVESGLLVLGDTINRLTLVKALLRVVEQANDAFGDDISVASKITFQQLAPQVLDALNSLETPLRSRSESPFGYNFLYLGAFLELPTNTTKFFNAVIELLYNELRIQYGRKLFLGYGYDEPHELSLTKEQRAEMAEAFQRENPPIPDEQFLIGNIYGFPKPEYRQIDVEYRTGRGSWLLADCLVRIRAQWDKLVKLLLLENYLLTKPGEKFERCLRQIEKAIQQGDFTPLQRDCIETVLTLGRSIDELREWRDNDVHSISPKVLGVLETRSSSSSLDEMWSFLLSEHNKVREAFIAAIGAVCLGKVVSSNAIVVNWPRPTHDPDIESQADVKLLKELRQAVQHVILLRRLCEQDAQLKSTDLLLNAELSVANSARRLYRFNSPSEASNTRPAP